VAADPRLRADLLKKLGSVTPQRLYQIVGELKRDHGPMSTEDAIYVLAHQRGMDLTKYIGDRASVDRIRGMVPRNTGPVAAAATPKKTPTPKPAKAPRPVRVSATVPAAQVLLPTSVLNDANRMADLYPKMYILENSIRNVIDRVMTAKHGIDWWTTCVAKPVRDRVQDRKDKEKKAPWHGARGTHDIYYSDFSHLKSILVKNWVDFEDIFPNQPWITVKLEELEPARNTLAHHNPVPEKEQTRLDVYFDDWAKLVEARQALIP
jgi:hypothetical protein